jgi:hypothetical protein
LADTKPITGEIGVAGVSLVGGYVVDPIARFRHLSGQRLRWEYERVAETDPGVAACETAVALVCRSVKWRLDPSKARPDGDAQAQAEAEFVTGCLLDDMSHAFGDAVSDALTMTKQGFSFLEVVYKRRLGPDQTDPAKRSRYTDGRIGIRKLAGRSQLSLSRWDVDATGGVQGFVQRDPNSGAETAIPIERGLLFRTSREHGSPEGKSFIRAIFEAWGDKRFLEQQEGVGAERDLTGMPVLYGPKSVVAPSTPEETSAHQTALKLVRDTKFNEQAGAFLSSETYPNQDGSPSAIPKWRLELLSAPGSKAVDTDKSIIRKQGEIFRRYFLQFLLLGAQGKGAYNLAESATDFFVLGVTYLLDQIADVINRHLLPRLWQLNGLDPELMPTLAHDDVAPQKLSEVAALITAAAGAGDPLGATRDGANYWRRMIGAPELPEEDPRAGLPGAAGGEEPEDPMAAAA